MALRVYIWKKGVRSVRGIHLSLKKEYKRKTWKIKSSQFKNILIIHTHPYMYWSKKFLTLTIIKNWYNVYIFFMCIWDIKLFIIIPPKNVTKKKTYRIEKRFFFSVSLLSLFHSAAAAIYIFYTFWAYNNNIAV